MFSGSTSIPSDMIRVKYPIEYELEPDTLEIDIQWITLRLKNVGDATLQDTSWRGCRT